MKLSLSEWFSAAHGKLCMHSNKYVSRRNGQLFSGTICEPRDLNKHPYTNDELAQQSAFRAASALRSLILQSDSLKADWQQRYREALNDKTTRCSSLSAYIMSMGCKGHISTEGNYQA